MNWIQRLTAFVFALLILAPVAACNLKPESASEIDNRMLAENPFSDEVRSREGADLTADITNYVNDRIGFRDDMILAYTVLNDRLFGKMVHPAYIYGEDEYVFGAGVWIWEQYGEFHEAFADSVKKIQDYCEARSVPFLFVFEPAKPAVLTEYLPEGYGYDRSWVDQFLTALDERGVRYLDNTVVLREKTEQGEVVFNRKYDANHWNYLGAYYSADAMLETMREDMPQIRPVDLSQFTMTEKLETSLPVSKFPIHEMVPDVCIDFQYEERRSELDAELERDPSFPSFNDLVNPERLAEGAPRTLVFQGSYMNGYGWPFLLNGLGEYTWVHNYQNVLDFPYYFNIFQPEYVIFEVTEYTLNDTYFSLDRMRNLHFNPTLEAVWEAVRDEELLPMEPESLTVERGEALTKLRWTGEAGDCAWALLGGEFDMKACDGGYEVTVRNEVWEANQDSLRIVTLTGETLRVYS